MTNTTFQRLDAPWVAQTVHYMMNLSKPLQAILPESEILLLERLGTWINADTNDVLVLHRNTGRSLKLVVSGSVVVERPDIEPVHLTATVDNPLVIGELTLLSHRLFRTATVTTTSAALVVELTGAKWDRNLSKLPTLRRFVQDSIDARQAAYAKLHRPAAVAALKNYNAYLAAVEAVHAN